MAQTSNKPKLRTRMIITVVIASAICVLFRFADVPLEAPAVLAVTVITAAMVEGAALLIGLWRKPKAVA